jgi:hypothetical protein
MKEFIRFLSLIILMFMLAFVAIMSVGFIIGFTH